MNIIEVSHLVKEYKKIKKERVLVYQNRKND